MGGFCEYFKNRLKENRFPLILTALLAFILTLALSGGIEPETVLVYSQSGSTHSNAFYKSMLISCLSAPSYISLALAFFAPIKCFTCYKSKRDLDIRRAIPISLREQGVADYLIGLLYVTLPTMLAYIANITCIVSKGYFSMLDLGWYAVHICFTLIFGVLFYTMYCFVYSEANNIPDGCIFMVGWSIVFEWIYGQYGLASFYETMMSPYGFTVEVSHRISNMVEGRNERFTLFNNETPIAITAFWVILGMAALVLLILRFNKKSYDSAGEVSDTLFGYNLLIPMFAVSVALFGGYENTLANPIEIVFSLIFAFVGYTLFRRGFKYKPIDYCVMGFIAILIPISLLK